MLKHPPNLLRALVARFSVLTCSMRRLWLLASHAGITLAKSVNIDKGVRVKLTDGGKLTISENVNVGRFVAMQVQSGEISIGPRSFIGPWTQIVSCNSIKLGADCLIAERVTIRDQDHRIHGDPEIPIQGSGLDTTPIIIGNNVWIAAGVVVLRGATIGDGAVVAANAVVKGEVPAGAIVAGVPAKIVGHRRGSE